MTHHIIQAERVDSGWSFILDGMAVMAARLCDIEPAVRLHLQRQNGDVTGDTIEVKIGGRPRNPAPQDASARLIDQRGHKRGTRGKNVTEHAQLRRHRS